MSDNCNISINEIFYSIQGEAKNSGKPTIFIRTSGCPFRCTYCDTEYAFTEGEKMSIDAIISKIKIYNTKYITVTGGEPLAQNNTIKLLIALLKKSYKVSIETSGLIDIGKIPKSVEIVMDIKTPTSNEDSKNIFNNLSILKDTDVIKFVIPSLSTWSRQ